MLGSFLEFSVTVAEVGEALQFYRSLGFEDLPTGDFVRTPYAAVWDGRIVVGLHDREAPPGLRFTRPQLRDHLPALRRLRLEIEDAELGDEAFNTLAFVDSAGHRVELVEARTHSPAEWDGSRVAACGRFVEISLPTHSVDESAEFWTALGLSVADRAETPYPRIRLVGDGCVLGFHQSNIAPGLSFAAPSFRARTDFLRAQGLRLVAAGVPQLGRADAARLDGPAGTSIYLHADES